MKKLLLTFAFILVAQLGIAQDAFKQDVLKYLEMSGQKLTIEKVTEKFKENVPAEKQAEFKKEMDASINDFMNKMADMYMTEFTHDDIKAFIKFYESPAGKKITAKTGVLYDKGQAIGQEWGMGLQGLLMKYMQ